MHIIGFIFPVQVLIREQLSETDELCQYALYVQGGWMYINTVTSQMYAYKYIYMDAHSYHNYIVCTHPAVTFLIMISCQDSLSPPSLSLFYFHVHVHVGLISRQEGDIQGSLELFRKAVLLNPNSAACVKQVARSVYVCINFVLYMWQSHVENEYYALTV